MLSEFQTLTRNHYGAEATMLDFSDPEVAAAVINRWVALQTAERIDGLIAPEMFDREAMLVLTNAVYFKSSWETPFNLQGTKRHAFFAYDGPVHVPLMSLIANHRYVQFEDVQVLEKPYADGRLSMVVLLPEATRESMERLEAKLNAEMLEKLLDTMKIQEVEVFLPRFRIEQQFDRTKALRDAGVRRAFVPGTAEFGGICTGEAFLNAVVQKTYIDVNEKGTEAAAATGLGFFGGIPVEPRSRVVFRADRPFVFLVRDRRSGSILFEGRFLRPVGSAAGAQ